MNEHSLKSVAKNVLVGEGEQLINAADRISDKMEIACDIITNHNGKIVISGMGKSGLIAQKIAATLCSIGNEAVFLHPAEAVHGDLGIYAPGDPTILISKSGATDEIVRLIPILKEFNSPLIAIVGNMDSFIAQNSDIVLNGTVTKEIDPLGVVPTTSSLVALAIGDALASVLMVQRDFDKEDFARNHPGGELGKQLALKVKSIMHPINDVAQITNSDSISSCAKKMTDKPLGAALLLENESLKGIVTKNVHYTRHSH